MFVQAVTLLMQTTLSIRQIRSDRQADAVCHLVNCDEVAIAMPVEGKPIEVVVEF